MVRWAFLMGLCAAGSAAAQAPAPDPAYDRYAVPAQLVSLPGGRVLNLDCRGEGSPTVLLLAGVGSSSRTWVRVHDRLAAGTKTCAFDPAGFGHSGPSPEPQDASHIAADLEAAMTAAGVAGPYVVVGHSAGGLQALVLADRKPDEVVGLVLVDPSYPGQNEVFERLAPRTSRYFSESNARRTEAFARCADRLATGPLSAGNVEDQTCLDIRPDYSSEFRDALAAVETAPRMRTKIANLAGLAASSVTAVNPDRAYGAMPLVVLTRGLLGAPPGGWPAGMPAEAETETAAADLAWVSAHESLASLSSRGEHRTIAGAGHSIQRDDPDAVISAVMDVIGAIPEH